MVTIASRDDAVAARAQALLSTPRFRCYRTTDVIGAPFMRMSESAVYKKNSPGFSRNCNGTLHGSTEPCSCTMQMVIQDFHRPMDPCPI